MIVGVRNGVAKKATIVDVKMLDEGLPHIENVAPAVRWAINDIIAKGRKGKATINLSFRKSSDVRDEIY